MSISDKTIKIHIITLSDRAAAGTYADRSGPVIKQMLQKHFDQLDWTLQIHNEIISDNAHTLRQHCQQHLQQGSDIIITTGGTGIGPRDITVDTILPMLDKQIPGIMEHIRVKYGQQMPNALLSRSIAGTIGTCQIYTLPGSPKAVKEYMTEILKTLEHLIYMIHGIDNHGNNHGHNHH